METPKGKVLIVEDEQIVRESLRDWLEADGYEVECVDSGEQALEKLKEEPFAVVILDLRLPGMTGLDVYAKAREFSKVKGIVITAYPSEKTLTEAKTLGIVDYLTKPFRIEDLEEKIAIAKSLFEIDKKEGFDLGVVSWRICDRNYDCKTCHFAQEVEEKYGRIAYIPKEELLKRKDSGGKRLCRFAIMKDFKPK